MEVEFEVNSTTAASGGYVGWAPAPCRLRVSDRAGTTQPIVTLRIESRSTASGGDLVFRRGVSGALGSTIDVRVPTSGESVAFQVAGRFGRASSEDGDVRIVAKLGNTTVGSIPIMVRIRKNANQLSNGERDRFVSAFARLNARGLGRFTDFREMHTSVSSPQAHGGPGFLPWHRIYLLDLERELQAIDPSVSLPYWRFDQPAPRLFSPDFIGRADASGAVQFSPSNPLLFWTTDGVQGFRRRPDFDTSTEAPGVRTEAQTLALGGSQNAYEGFRRMEGNPHGSAHVSFSGPIGSVPTAARDPLFFLLHCNVDRLWAKWQRRFDRFDPANARSYDPNAPHRINHNLADSMWPWNGVTGGDRPPTAPGGQLASSPCVSAPGPEPVVADTLDYQGTSSALSRMGFDYDDVRFA